MKRNNKKKNRLMLLLILLLAISVGFALLSTTLKINGTTNITKQGWSVYWSNVAVTEGSVDAATNIPTIGQDQDDPANTKVTWSTTLTLPGDFYEFTVDATNAGTIDAMITDIDETLPASLPSYVSYSVTYADGVPVAEKHLLPKATKSGNTTTPTTEKYKIRVEFLDTITPEEMDEIPAGGLRLEFEYDVTYAQADDSAKEVLPYIASCVRCVYAKNTSSNQKAIGDNLGVKGTDYFEDYTDLNSNFFLGYKLDTNEEITEAYGCVIENNKPYCFRGWVNESSETNKPVYTENVRLINEAYPNCNASVVPGGVNCTGTSTTANVQPGGMILVGPTSGAPCMISDMMNKAFCN